MDKTADSSPRYTATTSGRNIEVPVGRTEHDALLSEETISGGVLSPLFPQAQTARVHLPSGAELRITPLDQQESSRHLKRALQAGMSELPAEITWRRDEQTITETALRLPSPNSIIVFSNNVLELHDKDLGEIWSDYKQLAQQLLSGLSGSPFDRIRSVQLFAIRNEWVEQFLDAASLIDLSALGVEVPALQMTFEDARSLLQRVSGARHAISGNTAISHVSLSSRIISNPIWSHTHPDTEGQYPELERSLQRDPQNGRPLGEVLSKSGGLTRGHRINLVSFPSESDVQSLDRVVIRPIRIPRGKLSPPSRVKIGKILHSGGYTYFVIEPSTNSLTTLRYYEDVQRSEVYNLEEYKIKGPFDSHPVSWNQE